MNNVILLPDCYRKDEDSNNFKLLSLHEKAVTDIRNDLAALEEMLDINKAYGKTLDYYGEMVDQKRGKLDDTQYRYMIYTKIGRNIVGGDYNTMMAAIVQMFNCRASDIKLEDIDVRETDVSCVLKLQKLPIHVLIDAGFSSRQAVAMIETLLPVCVTIAADNFEGTFEFAEMATEYDKSAGFADDADKIGGYFGLLLGEDDTIPLLPI